MSEETVEPRTFEDLWLMRETSKEWFDGQLRYENVRNGADPEVGAVDSVSWHVVPSSERVRIIKNTHVISEVSANGHSFSCRVERETVAEYHSMDEFRDSDWWDLTMEKFAGGDADASWCGCEPGDEEGGCDFEPSVTEGEPPYNLYSLYEVVLRRHPRDEYAIEDDEVGELVDALLDICNAPGHDVIQRPQPSFDREALLALADELANVRRWSCYTDSDLLDIADRIREAIGAKDADD